MLKIGITGHRNFLNQTDVKTEIGLGIHYFLQEDATLVGITALASGADTIFAHEIIEAGGSLSIILPFDEQEYKKDFEHKESRKEFETLLNRNRSNIIVNNAALPQNKEERNKAYLDVGKRIVDEADILLAVWDGEPPEGVGGTGDIVSYSI